MAKNDTPVAKAERHLGMVKAARPSGAGARARQQAAIKAAETAVNNARRGQ